MKKLENILKRISAASVCAAVLVSAGSMPQVQAADNITVVLDPADASPFNGGQFEGWGTSLCWWANRIGYSEKLTGEAARLFFSEEGLSLDIARYNVGGGDDPTHTHIERSDSAVPGYATGFNEDGSIAYDWTKDENQRNIAIAAKKANPDLYFEGFSNSPPYFMTNSGCSSGADPAASDNLKSEQYDNFAKYIADVTKHFKDEWKIEFESYSPMNEPDTNYWGVNSPKQEGCHFDPGTSQSRMITATRKALDDAGLEKVIVAGMDETSIDKSVANLDKLTDEAKQALGRIDTHTYEGSQRAQLKEKSVFMNKTLWMSEVDNGGKAGTNPGDMGAGLNLANRILNDMNGMQPAAWVIWDIIDSHKDSDSEFAGEKNKWLNQSDGLWGVGMADHDKEEIMLTQKYYVFGQFTRYIQPGDTIIASSGSTLAAYNKDTGAIKIVAVNTSGGAKTYTFDMSAFSKTGKKAKAFRTSGSFASGEHWAELDDIDVPDKKLDYELPANSVTTFVIEQEEAGSVGYITVKGSDLAIKGKEYTYTSSTSDGSAVSWSVSDESVAMIDGTGKLTPLKGGTVTVTATSETAGSNSMEVTVIGVPKIHISEDAVTGTDSWKGDASKSVKKLVDGNVDTFFDGLRAGYAVFDLGGLYDISMIGYAPRSGYEYRMIDGIFSASRDNKNWKELYTVKSAPSGGKITYVMKDELDNADKSYRYIKYEVPDATQSYNGKQEDYNCNIAEVEIYGEAAQLTDREIVEEAAEKVSIDKEIYGNIDLPEKIDDVDIEWSVSDSAESLEFVITEFEILEDKVKYLCTVPPAYRNHTAYFAVYDSDNQLKAVRSAYIDNDGNTLFNGTIEGDFAGCTPKLMVWKEMTPAGKAADKVSTEVIKEYAVKPDGTVIRGSEDVTLYLTAAFKKGDEILEKKYEVTVKAAQDKADMAAYLFVHFVGTESNADSEQIYFSVSQDGTSWKTLNEGMPILRSEVGEKGVRDPHIIRSPEGDRFFLIATDLSIYNRRGDSNRWGTCQTSGSKSIVVWQSTDLVNWSEAELVKVAPDNAGCTWAPESVYDDETGRYMVFWASKTEDDNYKIQRIYRCFTRDFKSFTEPELYIDGGTVSNIDTTIIKEGDTYYRFTKNESNSSIIMEKSKSLSSGFTAVEGYKINGAAGDTVQGYEGPTAYKINGEDKWCLLLDYFSKSQGYKPFVTEDMSVGEFVSAEDFSFDGKYRHGGVMPITQEEYDGLVRAYMPVDEEETGEVIFSLDFDNETVEPSVGKAKVNGAITYTDGFGNTAGKAAVLDGSDFIEITKDDGTPLLAGLETFTVSFASKANKQSWWFYAAPNANAQEYLHEKYVGVLDTGKAFKCERYNNSGERSAAAEGEHDSEWQYITLVYRRKSYTLYINGEEISRTASAAELKAILGNNPIAYIGKANWGSGEYSDGAIDEFKVYNYALSEDEVKTAYADYGKE